MTAAPRPAPRTRIDRVRASAGIIQLALQQVEDELILPLWRWRPDSDLVAGRDRLAEIRLGQQSLTLAFRDDFDGEGDFGFGFGFDVMLPCPVDPECAGQAWAPAYSVTDLHEALTGAMDSDPDIVCTVHGRSDDVDQDADDHDQNDDPEGRASPEAQFADAVA